VGIGNPMRGDDAAGSMVARKIAAMSGVTVIDAEEVPENYLAAVVNRQPDTIVLIDSVDLDSAPGSVAILDREQLAGYGPSTHRVPVSLLMSLFEQETRARVFMIGIQPGHTEFLKPMSESVGTSVGQVAGMLNRVLGAHRDAAQGAAGNTSRAEVSA
jgi:hydrogenase 3 maturation protease